MYLATLSIENFRSLKKIELNFRPGFNILIGPNNSGKTAVVDSLRALLSTGDDGALRVHDYDLHIPDTKEKSTECTFKYIFRGLNEGEEADLIPALIPSKTVTSEKQEYEAHFTVQYIDNGLGGRLRAKRWCGLHEENTIPAEILDNLRSIYLPPLREPSTGLKPNRNSQLSRLVQKLSNEDSRSEIENLLKTLDIALKEKKPIADTQKAITERHLNMLGEIFSQELSLSLSPNDFQRIASRLSLTIEDFEVDQNGLGFNNLIYMAIVLCDLSISQDASYRALIVEEPEAHLHPQLQAVLLQYLHAIEKSKQSSENVQIFVTSHSPNFAALADIDSIGCIYRSENNIECFFPRTIEFGPKLKEKLQRYMNVTRAEIFFARKIIFVEGAAELFLIDALARQSKIDLKKHSVSIISVEGLNFNAFLPLFGEQSLKIRIAVITDADPSENPYPLPNAPLELSSTASSLNAQQNKYIKVFFARKTLEYDLAETENNRNIMLEALSELHPTISKELRQAVNESKEEIKAEILFKGMFERKNEKTDKKLDNVQKGAYAQALAYEIVKSKLPIDVPKYIKDAFEFITE